jgi:serine/threonine-protein kinase RsbW
MYGAEADLTPSLSWSLPPRADSVGAVRRLLRTLLVTLPDAKLDDVVLAASEVVTNAVLHGDGMVTFAVSGQPGVVRVEVTDDGGAVPRPRSDRTEGDEGGRGLLIVDAVATRWGVSPRRPGPGKTVWFEMGESAG